MHFLYLKSIVKETRDLDYKKSRKARVKKKRKKLSAP